jgi:hypothetical protein
MTTMSKPIELSKSQWAKLYEQLKKDYPPSVMLIRDKMRSKLGFVDREYKDWDDNIGKYGGWHKNCVMLDFYSKKKRTWFIMKYSEYINKEQVNDDF